MKLGALEDLGMSALDSSGAEEAPPGTTPAMGAPALLAFKQGKNVEGAQITLVGLGYDLGTSGPRGDGVDGSLGPKTKAALLEWQPYEGLPPTGVVDAASKARLEVRATQLVAYDAAAKAKTKETYEIPPGDLPKVEPPAEPDHSLSTGLFVVAAAVAAIGAFLFFRKKTPAFAPASEQPSEQEYSLEKARAANEAAWRGVNPGKREPEWIAQRRLDREMKDIVKQYGSWGAYQRARAQQMQVPPTNRYPSRVASRTLMSGGGPDSGPATLRDEPLTR